VTEVIRLSEKFGNPHELSITLNLGIMTPKHPLTNLYYCIQ